MALPLLVARRCIFQLPPTRRSSLALSQTTQFSNRRLFSSSIRCLLAQAKPKVKAPPQLPRPSAKPSKPSQYSGSSLASQVAQGKSTCLYESAPTGMFALSSYAASSLLFIWAGYYFTTQYIYPPAGLPWWVPPMYGVSSIVMFGMGCWIMSSPQRLVKSIWSLPGSSLRLRIVASRSLVHPFGKVMEVPLTEVTLRQSMDWVHVERNNSIAVIEERLAREELEKQESWWIRPMLTFVRGLKKIGRGMLKHGRNYWTRADFILIDVKGRGSWKINWKDSNMTYYRGRSMLSEIIRLK